MHGMVGSPRARRWSWLALPVAALAFLAVLLPISTAAADGGSVRFSTMPATASGADGRVSYSYSAAPGQHVKDYAAVVNSSDTDQTFAVYTTDAKNNDEGEFTLLPASEKPSDLGAWASVGDAGVGNAYTLTVPAQQSMVVPFEVVVPANASTGDHSAGLVVSQVRAGQVSLDARVATRLLLRVDGELQPMISIGGVQADFQRSWNPFNGTLDLTYTLTNPGNVALDSSVVPNMRVLGFIPVGSAAGTVKLDELMPGNTRTVHQQITGVPEGLFLSLGLDLTPSTPPGRPSGGELHPVHRDASVVVVPWSVLALLALIGFGVWFEVRRRRRQRATMLRAYEAGRAQAMAARDSATNTHSATDAGRSVSRPEEPPPTRRQASTVSDDDNQDVRVEGESDETSSN